MVGSMIVADSTVTYEPKEAGIVIVAAAWVIALASVTLAALAICGWRGAKNVAFDWLHMKVSFNCR